MLPANDTATQARGRYAVVSLGCPKNLVDTEQMLGRLDEDGYQMVKNVEDADFVVVNTCGFIASARQESLGAIDEMLQLKREGRLKGVVVTGCLAERSRESLLQERPDIDSLVGVFGRDEIVAVADRLLSGLEEQRTVFRPAPIRALADNHRAAVTPRHFAYLKISEGCDRLCTFLCDPQDARQACQQVDRTSRQRGTFVSRVGCSRDGRCCSRHDLLRHGPVWRAATAVNCWNSWTKSMGSIGFV